MNQNKQRRSAFKIMKQLIGLVKPLLGHMLVAVLFGVLGYLCAVFLTILASEALIKGLGMGAGGVIPVVKSNMFINISLKPLLIVMVLLAVLRGVFHYIEQYCNHYIAFKLLAVIRNKVFAALRRLCPAKLDGKDKGNLISVITTDIELLEVFYAHTISPIAIAFVTSGIMVIFISSYHIYAGLFALLAYGMVGILIPLWNGKRGGESGMAFRNEFGELNSFVLDSLRGLDEVIQYGQGENYISQLEERSRSLGEKQKTLSKKEGAQRGITNLLILICSFGMLFILLFLYSKGAVGFDGILICTVSMMGSFGPVVALSSLSNNLNQTLASGERVLSILEEKPLVEEVEERGGNDWKGTEKFSGAGVEKITFSYEEEVILKEFSFTIQSEKITGIHGPSGSGKSTLLKLLMRFWDVNEGVVNVSGENVKQIPTKHLRDSESYVTQDTHLFQDTIGGNIAVGKSDATRDEIIVAAKKASIHDFISSLPKGYDTQVGELGETLSGGEKQRIGVARAFLHDAPFILLDEPTSNLDSMNEGIILKSLKEESQSKTIIIVSHRSSTMNIADEVCSMENGRIS